MNWISLKDRMPKRHQYVMLLADGYWNTPEGVPDAAVITTGYLCQIGDTIKYWSLFGERVMPLDAFTHWRPSPDAPDDKELQYG